MEGKEKKPPTMRSYEAPKPNPYQNKRAELKSMACKRCSEPFVKRQKNSDGTTSLLNEDL